MTISSTNRKAGPYVGNDSATAFPFSFKVFSAADLYVVRADSIGNETVLTLVTDYTVSLNADQNASPGGTITLPAVLATGYTLTITSNLDYLQTTDLTNNGGFFPKVITNSLDRLTIFCQQLYEQIGRSLKLAISVPPGVRVTLPVPVPYKVLGWNAAGDGFENVDANYASALAADLAESAGASMVGFIQAGTGAVPRLMQDKAREVVSRADYSTEAQYKAVISGLSGGGFWADQTPAGNVWRFADRLFVGEAATKANGDKMQGADAGTWLTSASNAFWLERGATMLSVSASGEFGLVGASRCSDKSKSGYYGTASIGVAGIVENDDSGHSLIGWAGYFEANRGAGNGTVFCQEISVKNKGDNMISTPYNRGVWGAVGMWFPAGGDSHYNGVNANPCNTAILIGRGDDAGNTALPMSWNRGIVFHKDAITGSDGVTGTGVAISMAKGHIIAWNSSAGASGYIYSEGVTLNKDMRLVFSDDIARVSGNGDAKVVQFRQNGATSANNDYIDIYNGASVGATGAAQIRTAGASTNIDLMFIPQGAGVMRFGTWTSNADAAVNGYITIKDAAGNTRKLATIA